MIKSFSACRLRKLMQQVALVLFTGAATCLAHAAPEEGNVVRATLPNGFRVAIVRNTLAPVVGTVVNYLVGADETPSGLPGTAHALEHMMFRGSPGVSAEQLADMGSLMGGNFNADTQQAATQYLFTVPTEDLDVVLNIEALRMKGIIAGEQDWQRERGAIEQEVAQDLSNPLYVMETKIRAALFAGTEYAYDALGSRASFDRTTAAMLKSFHDQWYAPNNAMLIIVGNVDPQATLKKVEKLFAGIPAKQLPARPGLKLQPVAPQTINVPTNLPYALDVIALRMPGYDDPDYAAAKLLGDVLASERGELHELVPQGKALQAGFSFDPLPKSGIGYAVAAYPAGGNAKAVQSDIRSIIARIAKTGVPADLLAAAKLSERRNIEFQKNSISGLAMAWSEAVALRGLNSPDDEIARFEAVSLDDVNRAARKYLDLDRAVTAVLTPERAGKAISSKSFGGGEQISLGEAKPTPLPDWAQPLLNHLAVPQSTIHPVVSKLANGITLIVQPENVSDTVSVYGHVKNRPELEVPKGKEGLSRVLGELFSYGSESLDRIAFQKALDAIGADEHAGADFGVQTLTEHFDRGVALLADNELHPALPAKAFSVVRQEAADAVAGQLKSPSYVSGRALLAALFPKGDPSLREALPKTVGAITLDDVRDYYRRAFRPDLTTIVVIGKVTPEQAQSVIGKYFGNWSAAGPLPPTELPPVPPNARAESAIPDATRIQDRVTLAETVGLVRSNPDYYALQLGNGVLGGSFYSTRLTRDIRMIAGLVYSIQSSFDINKTRGIYAVRYASNPENVLKVQQMVEREIEQMQKTPVTDDELQRAKTLLLQKIALAEDSVDRIASGIIARIQLDLPIDEPTIAARHYLGLDAHAVQAAFTKWVRPEALVRVSQGPAPQ